MLLSRACGADWDGTTMSRPASRGLCPACYTAKHIRKMSTHWKCACGATFEHPVREDEHRYSCGSGIITPLTYRQQMMRDLLNKNGWPVKIIKRRYGRAWK